MDATELNIQPEDMVALKQLMQRAGFEQHDFVRLTDKGNLDLVRDIRRLIIDESQMVPTAHTLPLKPPCPGGDEETTTVFRRGNVLYHNGRKLVVLPCSELAGVKTYADLATYFKPEAHPPEELLDFLNVRTHMIPGNWHLYGERESWVIFLDTHSNDGSVHGLYAGRDGISREHWGAGDEDGFEKNDRIVVYEDTL